MREGDFAVGALKLGLQLEASNELPWDLSPKFFSLNALPLFLRTPHNSNDSISWPKIRKQCENWIPIFSKKRSIISAKFGY